MDQGIFAQLSLRDADSPRLKVWQALPSCAFSSNGLVRPVPFTAEPECGAAEGACPLAILRLSLNTPRAVRQPIDVFLLTSSTCGGKPTMTPRPHQCLGETND